MSFALARRDTASWVAHAGQAPAQAIAPGVRAGAERATGRDLGGARLHVGGPADAAARAFGAPAFTVGRDVHVDSAHHAPGTPAGDRLVAHELAHVAQQGAGSDDARPGSRSLDVAPADDAAEREADVVAGGGRLAGGVRPTAPAVQRAPTVGHKYTQGIEFDAAFLAKADKISYWVTRLREVYAASGPPRFDTDHEERDAVLAVAWAEHEKRASLAGSGSRVVTIPARGAGTKALAYRLDFAPPAKAGGQPRLDVVFLAEGAAAVAVTPATPKTAPTWPSTWQEGRFPGTGGLNYYAKAHPAETDQLMAFVAATPAGAFDQLVTTRTPGRGTTSTHASTFHVSGTKARDGSVSGLTVMLEAEEAPQTDALPKDYARRTIADLRLEALQKDPSDPLGRITYVGTVPPDEVRGVHYAIWSYFETKVRDAEVDALVPRDDGKTYALYTLRILPKTNDVEVTRLGLENASDATTLDPAKKQLDVRRIRGFDPKLLGDVGKLKTWLATRYPKLSPTGTKSADVVADANATLNAQAGTVGWFKQQYNVDVFDAKTAVTQMQKEFGWWLEQTRGMKPFVPTDLERIEWSLEAVSDAELAAVRGIALARQDVMIDKISTPLGKSGTQKTVSFKPDPTAGAVTVPGSARNAIVVFDRLTAVDRAVFTGYAPAKGDPVVVPNSVTAFTHEVGHLVGWTTGGATQAVRDAFAARFANAGAALKTDPITAYAQKSNEEYFAEAFAQYHQDPAWMQANLPKMYAWFETLARTGKAPP
ncbi:MAG: DUF4157 domain-containing protein [Gemmatirosa sp.]|nr:DUF4157 domain-containing protein [Gemmatirosa sp.]